MNVFYRTFAVLSWLFMSIHIMAQPSDVPRTFKVTYKADYRGLPISAKGIRELQQTASGQHLLKSSAKSLFATIEESSTFLLKDGIAQPQAYRYQRTGLGKNKKINLDFSVLFLVRKNKNWMTLFLKQEKVFGEKLIGFF